jgi:hypothetical protein
LGFEGSLGAVVDHIFATTCEGIWRKWIKQKAEGIDRPFGFLARRLHRWANRLMRHSSGVSSSVRELFPVRALISSA